ncbi:hypothetical protein HanPSC8_Chr17g0777251 [Helianthus annuus]|nr:hypothetical protein HanPSC8_Chr17g0777251 [Helianthus annuus]
MSHHSQPPTSLLSCSPHLPAAGVMFGPTKHVYNPEPPSLTSKLSDRPPPNGGGVRRRTRQKRGERERTSVGGGVPTASFSGGGSAFGEDDGVPTTVTFLNLCC